jgi:hypothetical protein
VPDEIMASRKTDAAMARRKPLHTLCALFALAMACQPGTADTEEALGDDVVLTADEPVAAFDVTVCIEGGAPNGLNLYSNFRATTATNEGSVELTLETLDTEEDSQSTAYLDTIDASTEAQPTSISLNTQRDWEASEDRRCQQQVVQVSVPSLAEAQTVTISEITITLTAEWAGLCGETPDEESLSIEAVRL